MRNGFYQRKVEIDKVKGKQRLEERKWHSNMSDAQTEAGFYIGPISGNISVFFDFEKAIGLLLGTLMRMDAFHKAVIPPSIIYVTTVRL